MMLLHDSTDGFELKRSSDGDGDEGIFYMVHVRESIQLTLLAHRILLECSRWQTSCRGPIGLPERTGYIETS
jgi:hypothetical protein